MKPAHVTYRSLDGVTDAQGAELSKAGATDAKIAARGYTSTP